MTSVSPFSYVLFSHHHFHTATVQLVASTLVHVCTAMALCHGTTRATNKISVSLQLVTFGIVTSYNHTSSIATKDLYHNLKEILSMI